MLAGFAGVDEPRRLPQIHSQRPWPDLRDHRAVFSTRRRFHLAMCGRRRAGARFPTSVTSLCSAANAICALRNGGQRVRTGLWGTGTFWPCSPRASPYEVASSPGDPADPPCRRDGAHVQRHRKVRAEFVQMAG
jgi:hypothetical protein